MTDPADLNQLHHIVSLQGATIGRHEEVLQDLLEGLHSLTECHDQGFKAIMEQISELAHRQHVMSETSQPPSNLPTSGGLVPQEPRLPPPERAGRSFPNALSYSNSNPLHSCRTVQG